MILVSTRVIVDRRIKLFDFFQCNFYKRIKQAHFEQTICVSSLDDSQINPSESPRAGLNHLVTLLTIGLRLDLYD